MIFSCLDIRCIVTQGTLETYSLLFKPFRITRTRQIFNRIPRSLNIQEHSFSTGENSQVRILSCL